MKLTDEDIQIIKESIGVQIPKIQWSKFSPDRSEQYVIRVDTYKELEDLRAFVLKDIPKAGKPFPDDVGPVAVSPEKVQKANSVCKVHGVPMKLRPAGNSKTTGKPYPAFWSCPERLPDGGFCNYRPPKENT